MTAAPQAGCPLGMGQGPLMAWVGRVVAGAAVVVFFGVLASTDRAPGADGPHMLFVSNRIGDALFSGGVLEALRHFVSLSIPHPPAGYLPSILTTPLLPLRWAIAAASTGCVLLLLDASIRLARPSPAWMGVAAWLLGCGAGLTWWSADHYGFDLPAAAAVLQALSWLQASEGLRRRRESLLFGLWLGVGFLTKYSVPMVLFLPTVVLCVPALFRRPLRVLQAAGAWAVLALPFYLFNGRHVLAYVGSALAPPASGGNYPAQLSLLQRFQGEGQLHVLAALKDAVGWPGLALAVVLLPLARRPLPALGLISGIAFLGTMNSREGRYVLPLIFLLTAAAVPRLVGSPSPARRGLALLGGGLLGLVGALGFGGTAATYRATGQATAPAHRPSYHSSATFKTLGDWPRPAFQFLPISEHPALWMVPAINATIASTIGPTSLVLLFLDQPPDAPGLSTYSLLSQQQGWAQSFVEVHANRTPAGVETVTTLRPTDVVHHAYVILPTRGASLASSWLEQRAHTVLASWTLPEDREGRLVALAEGYVQDIRGGPAPFQGGEGGAQPPPPQQGLAPFQP